jgi:hypothetical protein
MKQAFLLIIALLVLVAPAAAQNDATCGKPVLAQGAHGTLLIPVDTYIEAGFDNGTYGSLEEGATIQLLSNFEPRCVDGVLWYEVISDMGYGWIPDTLNGQPVFEPYVFTPEAPIPYDIPLVQPVMSSRDLPLPTVAPAANPTTLDGAFGDWDWQAFIENGYIFPPDPLALQMPQAYAGDLPTPPVDLSDVYFVQDANLNDEQLALLSQNGFVVVPGHAAQFDDVYRDYEGEWNGSTGKARFVTTDALLHSLYLGYQNALMFLELDHFYGNAAEFLMSGYEAAEAQYHEAAGTPLEDATRKAAVYYAVPLMLIAQGETYYVEGYEQNPVYSEFTEHKPSTVLSNADPAIIAEAQPLVDMALAGEGRLQVPILNNYEEDFSQYVPRSYYAGNPLLESYFRAMMWLGRITFLNNNADDTQTGLLVLRALRSDPTAYDNWRRLAEAIDFLVGPVDDYGPKDYVPLVANLRGGDFSLEFIGDADKLAAFQAQVDALPPPRVNSIPIPRMSISADELADQTRGFRLFGQRFTFDGYALQSLIYPAVGNDAKSRTLPLGLDIPAVLGSNVAYGIEAEAGATDYENYDAQMSKLRDEVNGISANDWLQTMAGGWLWTLQPLALRDAATTPPLMQTDAWMRKDLNSFLGSYTQLKHATLLYAEQPMGGLGGGGMEPPVISFAVVEPNPLVFARISIISTLLVKGLQARDYIPTADEFSNGRMSGIQQALTALAVLSAQLAEMARKEVAGEPLTHDEAYFLQENFGSSLWYIRYFIEEWIADPPDNTAIVADIASNAATGQALELGIGIPDLIYVITNSPYGLQMTRGAVYSYYEFTVPIDERMTDDEWRAQVADGSTPARPDWVGLFLGE